MNCGMMETQKIIGCGLVMARMKHLEKRPSSALAGTLTPGASITILGGILRQVLMASQMRKPAPRSLMAAKSMGLDATTTPTPDMPAMKSRPMPAAVPKAPAMVRRHPYSAASVMIMTTPSPGVRMLARLVMRKSAKRLDMADMFPC